MAVVVLVVTGILVLSGVFAGDDGDEPTGGASPGTGSTPTTSAAPSAEPVPEEQTPGVTVGTADNPYGPGDSFVVFDDWTITLGATDTDTWPDLEAHFQQTLPDTIDWFRPDPGMVFVSTPASVAYAGAPADQDRIESIAVEHLAADGTVSSINTCGRYGTAVEPFNTIDDEPLLEGVACAAMTPAQATGGMWRVFVSWREADGAGNYVHVFYSTS